MMKNRVANHPTLHSLCAGFTIAEVITAMAVGGLLLALAAPQLPTYQAEFQIGNGARQIAIDLQRARMKAVGENVFYRIVYNTNGTYVLQSSADGAAYTNNGVPVALPSGIHFVVTFGGLPQPRFNRLGILAADARLTIGNSIGQTKVVQMNTLGQITIS
jgi:prepilin-type N-terminal cleavage/methylation domain-containing protein